MSSTRDRVCRLIVLFWTLLASGAAWGDDGSLVFAISTATPGVAASTVPSNGDVNPYGVAFVPRHFRGGGPLRPGDVLVSNFNDTANAQGTGTTVVRVTPAGNMSLFFQGPIGLGLSTALGVLSSGFVLVGNLPSTDGLGTCTPGPNGEETGVEQGSLLVLDRHGNLVTQLTSATLLNGPWDLAVFEEGSHAHVFVSNALSGSVTRLDVRSGGDGRSLVVERMTQIASGYTHRCDPAALVVGPTGVAYDEERDVLYVASTGDNAIYAVRDALERRSDHGPGRIVVQDATHMHGPLGLVLTPNDHLIVTEGDAVNPDSAHPSEISEFTTDGEFIGEFSIDPAPGSAFGMALDTSDGHARFAAVDDGLNTLDIWTLSKATLAASLNQPRAKAGTMTTTALSAPATATTGQSVTLTATVTGGTTGVNVTFMDGSATLGTGALNSSGVATYMTSMLAAGSHSLTASYPGDATTAASASTAVTLTVSGSGMGYGGGGGGGGGYGGGAFGPLDGAALLLVSLIRGLRRRAPQRAAPLAG